MKTASFQTFKGAGRVSIARFAPRGTPAGYRQYKGLAPGTWFNSVPKPEYVARFAMEILAPLNPQKVWDELHTLAAGEEPVLLCWEKPPLDAWDAPGSNSCHRRLVADWFAKHLKVEVPELVVVAPAVDASQVPLGGGIGVAQAARVQRRPR